MQGIKRLNQKAINEIRKGSRGKEIERQKDGVAFEKDSKIRGRKEGFKPGSTKDEGGGVTPAHEATKRKKEEAVNPEP